MVDAMSTVKELVPRPDGIAAEPLLAGLDEVAADAEVDEDAAADDEEEEDVEEDEQPAATTAATAARATQPSRGRGLNAP
jgi:hypothetical protein